VADITDGSPKGAAKAIGGKTLDVVVDYLLPVGGIVLGLTAGSSLIGGTYSICSAVNAVGKGNVNGTRIGGFLAAGLWAAIGFAFWRLRKADGWIAHAIGGFVGGMFFGSAIQALVWCGFANAPVSQGPIDQLISGLQGVVQGG